MIPRVVWLESMQFHLIDLVTVVRVRTLILRRWPVAKLPAASTGSEIGNWKRAQRANWELAFHVVSRSSVMALDVSYRYLYLYGHGRSLNDLGGVRSPPRRCSSSHRLGTRATFGRRRSPSLSGAPTHGGAASRHPPCGLAESGYQNRVCHQRPLRAPLRETRTVEGWLRLRDPERGAWLSSYTRNARAYRSDRAAERKPGGARHSRGQAPGHDAHPGHQVGEQATGPLSPNIARPC